MRKALDPMAATSPQPDDRRSADETPAPSPSPPEAAAPNETASAIRWAETIGHDDGMTSVNWLAADVDPERPSAERLLVDPEVSLEKLLAAKSAYKTLRVVGESSAERRLGARWYAATIAAGIVHHGARISSQSDGALDRGFAALVDDEAMPAAVRELVVRALFRLRSGTLIDDA